MRLASSVTMTSMSFAFASANSRSNPARCKLAPLVARSLKTSAGSTVPPRSSMNLVQRRT